MQRHVPRISHNELQHLLLHIVKSMFSVEQEQCSLGPCNASGAARKMTGVCFAPFVNFYRSDFLRAPRTPDVRA